MPTMWKIEPITISDATAIAKNTCGAFWEEPMWRLQWSGIQIPDTDTEITPEFLASQLVKRQPLRLLQDRDTLRYQKAVDPETGELVGYARWRLPETATTTTTHDGDESNEEEKTKEAKEAKWAWAWTDAQIPDISATDKTLLEKVAETVWWEPRTDIDVLDEGNDEVKNRIMEGRGEYMVLEFLAVHPRNKGKGIATSLVQEGIRQAKILRLPILTVAYKGSRGVYARAGFVEIERTTKDDRPFGGSGDYTWCFMVYDVSEG